MTTLTRFAWRGLEAAVAVALIAVLAGSLLGQPVLLGFVETGSMEPTLSPGDGFVAVPTPLAGGIDEGDVVTFYGPDGLTTHRVVDVVDGGFVTRGDANAFSDQADGDPVVTREQVVAVALAVDGTVVSVPGIGALAEGARGVIAALAGAVGLSGDPAQLAAVLLAVTVTALVLDELLAEGRERSTTERSVGRDVGYGALTVVVIVVGVVVVAATASMVLSTGATTLPFDAVEPADADRGGIPLGESQQVAVSLSNPGVLPSVAVLEAADDRGQVSGDAVVVGPRSSTTVNATLFAPSTPGRYEAAVVQYRYVGVLPPSVVGRLHAVDPWVARGTIAGVLGAVAFAVVRLLVGRTRGRVRLTPSREVPLSTAVRRRFRALYRYSSTRTTGTHDNWKP